MKISIEELAGMIDHTNVQRMPLMMILKLSARSR
jgi:hypothetical protein